MSALAAYLRDHHAAGCAGTRLAGRIASRAPSGSPARALAAEIEEDLVSLEGFMGELGVEPSRTKDALARTAERISRVKQSGVFGKAASSELIDLEALLVGIAGKRALWISLREVAAVADPERLQALIDRASTQLETVEAERRRAARSDLS